MAFLKFSFVFICSLLVSQIAASPLENVQEDKRAEELGELIEKVTDFIDKSLHTTEKVVNSLIQDDIKSFQKATIDVTLKVLGGFKKYADKLIEAVSPQLNADAKKVSKCLQDNSNSIINVIVDYYNRTTSCLNPALKDTLVAWKPLIADLEKVDEGAASLAPEMKKCGNDICIVTVSRKLIADVNAVPAILRKDVPVIVAHLKALWTVSENCATKEAVPWKKESADLFNKVATCMRS